MSREFDVERAFEVAKKLVVDTGFMAMKMRNKYMQVREGGIETIGQIRDISTEADWRSLRKMLEELIENGFHRKARIHVELDDAKLPWAERLIRKFSRHARYRITCDPIDGTANYASTTPAGSRMVRKLSERVDDLSKHLLPYSWGPMIGLEESGTSVFGVVFQPSNKKLFYARHGTGAFQGNGSDKATRIKTDYNARFKMGNVIYTNSDAFENFLTFARSGLDVRHHGSYAYTAMRIAEGYSECIVAKEPKLHDLIPPMCIVREAGGVVVDENGNNAVADKGKYVIFAPNMRYAEALFRTFETRGDKVLEREL